MAFIKFQNLKKTDDFGKVVAGTALLIDVFYTGSGLGHSRQKPMESLEKVLSVSSDRRSWVFKSRTRGIIAYDADLDEFSKVANDDPRISGVEKTCPAVHTVFRDDYLFLTFMKNSRFISRERRSMISHRLYF